MTVVLFSGCSKISSGDSKPAQGMPPVPVLVAQAVAKNVPVKISAIGNVMAHATVTIRSQITGQLKDVHFREGAEVKRGDLLYTIDPRPFQAALEQSRANLVRDAAQLQNAQIQFDRSQKLFDSQLVSREDFDNTRATLDAQKGVVLADKAAITNAILSLEYASIRAPMDGVVGAQLVYAGNIIKAEDDQMVMINQIHPIYVLFSVPERYLTEIKTEMRNAPLKVEVSVQNTANVCTGELTFVDNAVDMTTGTIQLKGTFANTDNVLWPGQFVQVSLTLSELSGAVVVPSQAVQTGQNGQYVYVVKEDQTVEQRPVTVGAGFNGGLVVQSGLKAGETVVTDGQLRLAPGLKVSFKSAGGTEKGQ